MCAAVNEVPAGNPARWTTNVVVAEVIVPAPSRVTFNVMVAVPLPDVSGPTAAALHPFDGFRLARPFHLSVPRGQFLNRVGRVESHNVFRRDGFGQFKALSDSIDDVVVYEPV